MRAWGMAAPDGAGSHTGGTGNPAQPVHPNGTAAPNAAGSQAAGTGSPTQLVDAALGVPVGDGSPQWRELTGGEDGVSSLAGGRSLRCACGARA